MPNPNEELARVLAKRGLRPIEPVAIPQPVDVQTRLAVLEAELNVQPEKEADHA